MSRTAVVVQDGIVPTVDLGGISVSRLGREATRALVRGWLEGDRPRRVSTANLSFLRQALADPELEDCISRADLVTADGQPLLWLARKEGQPIAERVTGSDLVPVLIGDAARLGLPVFFLGGAPGDAAAAAERSKELHPALVVAGVDDRQVLLRDSEACRSLAAEIRGTGARLLLVGLGCPNQEIFLDRHLAATGASVGIGVGGTFSFIAGRVRRAPAIVQKLSLEWAWRIKEEPRRLFLRYWKDGWFLLRWRWRRRSRMP